MSLEVSLKRTLDNPTSQAYELGFDRGVYANYQNCPSIIGEDLGFYSSNLCEQGFTYWFKQNEWGHAIRKWIRN